MTIQEPDDNASRVGGAEKAWSALLLFILLFGGAPIFAKLFGHPFLPSYEYYKQYYTAAYLVTIATFLALLYHMVTSDFIDRVSQIRKIIKSSIVRKILAILFGLFFFPMLGYIAIAVTLPMILATAFGETTVLSYQVDDPKADNSGYCPSKVTLFGLPFMYDEVCDVPKEFRKQLEHGMTIELIGRGTGNGIFYNRIRLPHAESPE